MKYVQSQPLDLFNIDDLAGIQRRTIFDALCNVFYAIEDHAPHTIKYRTAMREAANGEQWFMVYLAVDEELPE